MSDNLELWNSVQKTDPAHTKKANVKGNNITSIRPQYQIYNATKQWGSYGSKWGFRDINLGYELKEFGLVTFKAVFYYPGGEFEILNTISFYRDNAKSKLDDEFAKKVETDSLTKALSKLGFNSDVFMGRFDDIRYVEEVKKEFAEDRKPALTDSQFEATKKGSPIQIQTVLNKYRMSDDQRKELQSKLKPIANA